MLKGIKTLDAIQRCWWKSGLLTILNFKESSFSSSMFYGTTASTKTTEEAFAHIVFSWW